MGADVETRRGVASTDGRPSVILPSDPRKRFMGSGEVAAAVIAALLSGLIAGGLGWIAAGLF
jgi:hypothetical protein